MCGLVCIRAFYHANTSLCLHVCVLFVHVCLRISKRKRDIDC